MIKKFLLLLLSCFFIVSFVVIYFWRDTQFQPDANDLLQYFVFLPLLISTVLISPWLIYHFYQRHKEKKQQALAAEQSEEHELTEVTNQSESTWLTLNLYAAGAYCALGENDAIFDGIKSLASPLLDPKLSSVIGLPVLSYRIEDLDQVLSQDVSEEMQFITTQQQRIMALIQHQLQSHQSLLSSVADHLKQSSLFYESQNLHEYRMHPAWIDPTHSEGDETEMKPVERVYRLDKLNLHILLSEDVIHTWNDLSSNEIIQAFFYGLGIIPQKFHIEYHFVSGTSVVQQTVELFERIQKQPNELSLIITADSEIDQDILDERLLGKKTYIPAEFVSSCCVAHPAVQIEQLQPLKTLKLVLNQNNLNQIFEELNIHDLPQYDNEEPFVLLLEDGENVKVVKKLEQFFAQSPIEPHHYLYCKPMFGETKNLSKAFGLMLGAQFPDPQVAFVYGQDLKAFIQTFSEYPMDQESVAIAD